MMLTQPRNPPSLGQEAAFAPTRTRIRLGAPGVDAALGGGLLKGALHEIYAASTADTAAASGFCAGLALRAAGGKPVLWITQDMLETEAGRLHGPGLAAFGLDPARVILVRARDAGDALRAGAAAARSPALGAAVISPWGEPQALDLTASRRLSLAAEASGVTVLLLRAAAAPAPGSAATRWLIGTEPSRALAANAPGFPAFHAALARQRGGVSGVAWRLEWNREQGCFEERRPGAAAAGEPALSRAAISLPRGGAGEAAAAAASGGLFRKAG